MSKDYASRNLNQIKKKQAPSQPKLETKNMLEELRSSPVKAEIIYPKMKDDSDEEIDEKSLKSIEEVSSLFYFM